MTLSNPAAMDQPIRDFSDCHVSIADTLDELSALSQQRVSAPQRRETAGRILRFFRDVITVHHEEEEAELFPAVLDDATAGDERTRVEAIVARLVSEHRRLDELYTPLAAALSAMEGGDDVALDESAVATLVADYLAHARFEEEDFLPLAKTILQRNGDHMAALGLALHIRHASDEVRRRFGFI